MPDLPTEFFGQARPAAHLRQHSPESQPVPPPDAEATSQSACAPQPQYRVLALFAAKERHCEDDRVQCVIRYSFRRESHANAQHKFFELNRYLVIWQSHSSGRRNADKMNALGLNRSTVAPIGSRRRPAHRPTAM